LKIARFLLEYVMLWDEKSTHYQRGSPEMEAAAYALVMAEKKIIIEGAEAPKSKPKRRMVRSGEVIGKAAKRSFGEAVAGQTKRDFGDGSDSDKENEDHEGRRYEQKPPGS
jgi:hypothetical protein